MNRTAGAALHRLGTRLQDVDFAGRAVLAPLDVHRLFVVLLDDERLACQRVDVLIVETEAGTIGLRHIHGDHTLGGARRRVHHFDRLATDVTAQDGLFAGPQRGLVNVEFVRVHSSLYDRFTQAVGGSDENNITESGVRVEREHHTAAAQVAARHVLHARR